jgi:hypothetical protein
MPVGFAIGNVAAFDMDDPKAIVSPGGVGFDINCGVRLIRTDLDLEGILLRILALRPFGNLPVHPLPTRSSVLFAQMSSACKSSYHSPCSTTFL